MKNRNIALVVPAFDKGGLEQVVLNLYEGYRKSGHGCVVLVENNVSGYMASRINEKNAVVIFNKDERLFLNMLLKHNISIVHYHYSVFGLDAVRALGLRSIYTLHNVYTWLDDQQFSSRANVISKADRIVAVSNFVRNYFCERSKLRPSDVQIIPNGIDLAAFSSTLDPLTRRELGAPESCYLFAHIASVHRNKHHAILIGAAELMLREATNFYIAMIGNVGDAAYKSEIESLISCSPARNHIGFVDHVSFSKLSSLYRDVADCVVLPSIQEGCSNVVLECLATECPLIVTDVGNAREAAALSNAVSIVSPAFEDIIALTPINIEEISRNTKTQNVENLSRKMLEAIKMPKRKEADPLIINEMRNRLSTQNMIDAYLSILP